jgi:hypothetical protein
MAFVFDVRGFVSNTRMSQRLQVRLRRENHQANACPEHDMKTQLRLPSKSHCPAHLHRVR